MGGIYTLLGMGSRSFSAFQSGIGSAGHNLSNAGTLGFRRTRIDLSSELAPPIGGGVRSGSLHRIDDPLLSRRERSATSDLGHATDLAAAAAALEFAASPDSGGLVDSITRFFAVVTEAAASPNDPAQRAAVVRAGQSLAEAFRTLQASVRESIRETEERIHDYASRASELAGRLAQLNAETRTSGDPTLLDRRDQVAEELAALTGGQVLDGDHGYRFMLEDGTVLVDGTRAARLEAVPDPAYANQSRIDVVDGASRLDVTGSIGGRMSGQIELRDRIAPQLGAEVDRLAFDLTSEVNAIHAAHAGLDGTAGRSFFAPSGSVTGAAASMAVDPSLLQDPGNLGAADPGVGPGSNAGLRSLADLADRFSSSAIDTMSSLGAEVASAIEGEAFASARFDALASLRDSLSGVSIEEEMMRLSEFQRAAEASLQFVATVDTLLEEMIRTL